jgi:hypothetical protein
VNRAETLAAVLAEHTQKHGIRDMRVHCWCGWASGEREGMPAHRAHVAAALDAAIAAQEGERGTADENARRDTTTCAEHRQRPGEAHEWRRGRRGHTRVVLCDGGSVSPVVLDLSDRYFDGQTLPDALKDYDHVHSTTGICVKNDGPLCAQEGDQGCEHKYPEPRRIGPPHPPTPRLCLRCGQPERAAQEGDQGEAVEAIRRAQDHEVCTDACPGHGWEPDECPTCSWPSRETVGMVCQTCGTDYSARDDPAGLVVSEDGSLRHAGSDQ